MEWESGQPIHHHSWKRVIKHSYASKIKRMKKKYKEKSWKKSGHKRVLNPCKQESDATFRDHIRAIYSWRVRVGSMLGVIKFRY